MSDLVETTNCCFFLMHRLKKFVQMDLYIEVGLLSFLGVKGVTLNFLGVNYYCYNYSKYK